MSQILHISDRAAKRIVYLFTQEKNPENLMLRIAVSGGGCSGFQYAFTFDHIQLPDDYVFQHNDARVIVDETSLNLLDGTTLDFTEELAGSMFVLQNPNATSQCGCGNSFSI